MQVVITELLFYCNTRDVLILSEMWQESVQKKDTCFLVDLDGGHVSLQSDDLPDQLIISDPH